MIVYTIEMLCNKTEQDAEKRLFQCIRCEQACPYDYILFPLPLIFFICRIEI